MNCGDNLLENRHIWEFWYNVSTDQVIYGGGWNLILDLFLETNEEERPLLAKCLNTRIDRAISAHLPSRTASINKKM